jgi:hypothetical protein
MWVGVIGTALWLFFTALFIAYKWEKLSVADPNVIGDTLAGFVAPLAFLWLIIATWLQRQELGLQRKELTENRQVLSGQQRELEATAKENAEQTRIMQQTLQTTIQQSVYDEHRTRLYYLAKYIQIQGRENSILLFGKDGDERTYTVYRKEHITNLDDSIAAVDAVLVAFGKEQFEHRKEMFSNAEVVRAGDMGRIPNFVKVARHIFEEATLLGTDEKYLRNPLVAARLRGINFDAILGAFRSTCVLLEAKTGYPLLAAEHISSDEGA